MKLLFDENLSHRLIDRLSDVFPESRHVRQMGLASSPDRLVLGMAELFDLVLVTKDADFDDLVVLGSDTGKLLRLDIGNCTTDDVERVLREHAPALDELFETNRIVTIVRR